MYPLDIPGITGESMKKFMFDKIADRQTMMQLVDKLPPEMYVVFYDQNYPSPSDPGAFVKFKRNNDQYTMQSSNHGWSKNWETVTAESLVDYLSQCSKFNMGPETLNMMFAHFELTTPSQIERATKYYEQAISIAREAGDRHKEADALFEIGLLFWGQRDHALEYYSRALNIYHEIGERDEEAMMLGNIAEIHIRSKQFEKAIETLQKQVRIFEETRHHNLDSARRVLASTQQSASKKWWQFWK
jgi:hypothetical protein